MPTRRNRINYVIPENDRLSSRFKDYVPDYLEGSDQFLDIITWNIRYFNRRDRDRIQTITEIMNEINGDIFVLQEIEENALDAVVESLIENGSGLYKVEYGTTGGDQRVAIMYDMEWVRSSQSFEELFFYENPTIGNKKVFPRLPLHSMFIAKSENEPFDFHLVGVHLKSQRGGGENQRAEAARRLASWIMRDTIDRDAIIAGDWNAPSNSPEWSPIRELEKANAVRYGSWNPLDEITYLSKKGKGTRLDYIISTASAASAAKTEKTTVIEWNQLFSGDKRMLEIVIDKISDHLPVVSRFYFEEVK